MKIAIVGSGIAGLVAAYKLHRQHEITVFESDDRLGGHTHTHDIDLGGQIWPVDTGFIVFNDWTYPNFIRLMDDIGVASQPSAMSFSVSCQRTGLEYNGTTLNALFAQRRNLLNPGFYRMILDILRFNREAPALLQEDDDQTSLGDYLAAGGYSRRFREHYILPMGGAIWSATPERMLAFPARYFIRFFHNHGMLSVDERPVWRVIRGGSRAYLGPLTAGFADRIRLATPVASIVRDENGATLRFRDGAAERFDAVILACHSDQALRLLDDPSPAEYDILSAIPYQENEAVLHTDTALLPRSRLAWAAWNYHILREARDRIAVTYNMNILQGLAAPETFCVSLNPGIAIDPARIIKRLTYHHPVYTPEGIAAQRRHADISGVYHTYYAGAYWGYGFHEDGVKSGLRVVEQITGESHVA